MLTSCTKIWNGFSDRTKGVFLSVLGVMVLTPDSLLVRKCDGVPSQTVLFYRNLIFGTAMLIGLIVTEKRNAWNKLVALGKWGVFTGVIFGASLWFMVVGIQNTAAANVLVIQAANPLFAAIFGWLIMRETLTRITLATSAVCVVAIALIFAGNLSEGSSDDGDSSSSGSNNTIGLLCAMASSISFGLYVVMLRWLSVFQAEEIDMMPCNIVAGFVATVLAACTSEDLSDVGGVAWVYIFLQGLGVLALGFTILTVAPSYIPAPEVSLYTLIETVLGPVWVYLGGYEAPSAYAVAGGALLLLALAVHSVVSMQEASDPLLESKKAPTQDSEEGPSIVELTPTTYSALHASDALAVKAERVEEVPTAVRATPADESEEAAHHPANATYSVLHSV